MSLSETDAEGKTALSLTGPAFAAGFLDPRILSPPVFRMKQKPPLLQTDQFRYPTDAAASQQVSRIDLPGETKTNAGGTRESYAACGRTFPFIRGAVSNMLCSLLSARPRGGNREDT